MGTAGKCVFDCFSNDSPINFENCLNSDKVGGGDGWLAVTTNPFFHAALRYYYNNAVQLCIRRILDISKIFQYQPIEIQNYRDGGKKNDFPKRRKWRVNHGSRPCSQPPHVLLYIVYIYTIVQIGIVCVFSRYGMRRSSLGTCQIPQTPFAPHLFFTSAYNLYCFYIYLIR